VLLVRDSGGGVVNNVTELRPGVAAPPPVPVPRVPLGVLRRMDVEAAREFLTGLDGCLAAEPSPARLAYLIGRLEGHAQSLVDVLDAITEVV
jgi:hypothetical protein